MKDFKSKEAILKQLKVITLSKSLEPKFLEENLSFLKTSTGYVEDARRRNDLQEEANDVIALLFQLMKDDLPRLRKLSSNKSNLSSSDAAEFQSLAEYWEATSQEALSRMKEIAKEILSYLSKSETISYRSQLRNASFQVREMRSRLSSEGYALKKKFQAQADVAEGWLLSAPPSGEGSASNIRRFIKDCKEFVSILDSSKLPIVGGTGYFLSDATFLSDEKLLRLSSLERSLSRPEQYYKLNNFQADDLAEAEQSAQRRVERLDAVTKALSSAGLKGADLLTLGLASPVFRAFGSLYRGTAATLRFASNVPSFARTLTSKIGDSRLIVKQSRLGRGASSVSRALLSPVKTAKSARNLISSGVSNAKKGFLRNKSKIKFASQAFRSAKTVRERMGILTGSRSSALHSNPNSPFYKENAGEQLARMMREESIESMGATPVSVGSTPSTSRLNANMLDELNSEREAEETGRAHISKASVRGGNSSAVSSTVLRKLVQLEAYVGTRFEGLEALIRTGSTTSGSPRVSPTSTYTSTSTSDYLSEADLAEQERDSEEDRSFFRRQVKALERLVQFNSVKKKPSSLLHGGLGLLKSLLSTLGLTPLIGILKKAAVGSVLGRLLLSSAPSLLGKGLSFIGRGAASALSGATSMGASALRGLTNLGKNFSLRSVMNSPLVRMGGGALARLAGPLGAFMVGWEVGSALHAKYGKEIADSIDWTIETVTSITNSIESVTNWFSEFLGDPVTKLRQLGSTVGKAWSDSSLKDLLDSSWGKVTSVFTGTAATPVPSQTRSSFPGRPNNPSGSVRTSSPMRGPRNESTLSPVRGGPSLPSPSTASSGRTVTSNSNTPSAKAGAMFKVAPGVNMNLDPSTGQRFSSLVEEYITGGGKSPVVVNSGKRTFEDQSRLYASNPKMAAKPGTSDHERGFAVDVNREAANEMDRMGLLKKYGFSRPVSSEPWHLTTAKKGSLYVGDTPTGDQSQSPPGVRVSSASSSQPSRLLSENSTSANVGTSSGQVGRTSSYSEPVQAGLPTSEVPVFTQIARTATSSNSSPSNRVTPSTQSEQRVSLSSIPTFSYLDGGFFILNAGMLG